MDCNAWMKSFLCIEFFCLELEDVAIVGWHLATHYTTRFYSSHNLQDRLFFEGLLNDCENCLWLPRFKHLEICSTKIKKRNYEQWYNCTACGIEGREVEVKSKPCKRAEASA